jgi:hypothetical protein
MKKVTGYRLQVTVSILILIFTATYHLQPATSLAQDSSPSGSLLQKLTELKEDIASKAAQIKTEMSKKVQNKAIIGSILDIRSTDITIQTLNSVKTVKYDEFTEIIGSKGKKIEIDTLETRDNIAALGDVDDKNVLVAQRLIFLDNLASNSAQLIWGQIQKTSGSVITIKDKSGQTQTILTNAQTAFFLGSEEASMLDAKVEKYLTARVIKQKDNTLRARFIYFIPSPGFNKPLKQNSPITKYSSPSATPIR